MFREFVKSLSPSCWLTREGLSGSAGSQIATWSDISGNNRHFTQATAGYRPVVTRGDNKENRKVWSDDLTGVAFSTARAAVLSATEFKEDGTAANSHFIFTSSASFITATVRVSIKAKRGTGSRNLRVSFFTTAPTPSIDVNLSNGAELASANLLTKSIEGPDADGFYKITYTAATNAGTPNLQLIMLSGGDPVYDGDNASSIHVKNISISSTLADPDYIQTTTVPLFRGINGKAVARFDGVDDLVTITDFIGTPAQTVFVVARPVSEGGGNVGTFLNNGSFQHYSYPGQRVRFCSAGATPNTDSANGSFPFHQTTIVGLTRTAAGVANHYINGVLSGPANQNSGTPAAATTALCLGNSSPRTRTFHGEIAEIITFSKVLTLDQIVTISQGLEDEFISSPSLSFPRTTSDYQITARATIKAKNKRTLQEKQIFLSTPLETFDHEESLPIIRDLSGIGSSTHNEIPTELRGVLVVDNDYSIGFKRRFSDLLDSYVLINQEIIIDFIDQSDSSVISSNTATINSVDFAPSGNTANIGITKRVLTSSPVNYIIKDGSAVIDGASGSALPLILGADQEVRPIRITKNRWGYGTNFYNSNNTKFSENGTPTLFAADSSGYLTEVKSAPGSTTLASTCFVDWAVTTKEDFEEYPWEGIEVALRPVHKYVNTTFSIPDLTGYLLNQVRITMMGRSTITTVLESELFTVEVWECGLDYFDGENSIWLGNHSLPSKMVASGSVPRTDYESQIKANAEFDVHIVLDRPVALTAFPLAATGYPFLNHVIIFKQGYSAVSESVNMRRWAKAVDGSPSNATLAYNWDLILKIGGDDSGWAIYNLNDGITPEQGRFLIKFYGCPISTSNLTPATTLSNNLETTLNREKNGLTPSVISITSITPSGDDTLTYDDLKLMVRVNGLSQVGSSSVASRVDHVTKLLLSQYSGTSWVEPVFDSTFFSDTHSGNSSRVIAGTVYNESYNRELLTDILFWLHGKVFAMRADQKKVGLFLFGTPQTIADSISDENCILERVQEMDLSTIVNSAPFQYRLKNSFLAPVGLSITFPRFTDSSNQFTRTTSGQTSGDRQEDSIALFGQNPLKKFNNPFVSSDTVARAISGLFISRYSHPAYYILARVPLRLYNHLELGDVILLSHSLMPCVSGGDSSVVKGVLDDESGLAEGAAFGHYEKLGKSYRCLIEGREVSYRRGEPPMLRLALLSLHNTDPDII
jgi:hypothetical protein